MEIFTTFSKKALPNFETYLNRLFLDYFDDQRQILKDAMKYSLLNGGKRVRPQLLLASHNIFSENEQLGKTEPVFSSSVEKIEENESEDKNPEDNNLSMDENEEFSAEETESSAIDDELNQETEEELLDIPTFLRRQAN